VCFHLKRKFRKFLMKGRGKLGRERAREEGAGVLRESVLRQCVPD
jgi:hypothetical protein